MYRTLSEVVPEFQWKGPAVPLPKEAPSFFNPFRQSKQIRTSDFMADAFGFLGIAGHYGDDGNSTLLLTGEEAEFFSDKEIKKMLTGKLILDFAAVQNLLKRGFGKEIGVRTSP